MEVQMTAISFKLRYTNCFLIRHESGWLLIDTGYEWEREAFDRCLARVGVRRQDVTHLLLTHAHDDHAGLLGPMVEANPELKIIMSERAAEILRGGAHVADGQGGYVTRRMRLLALIKAALDKSWTHRFPPYIKRENDILVHAPTRLADLGLSLEGAIHPTPGHTDDSISLVMDDGECYCGDAAANFFRFAGTKRCVIYVRDIDRYYRSWDALLGAGAMTIRPSHGKPFPAVDLKRFRGRIRRLYA